MTRELALLTVTAYLREEFGRLLEARNARHVRRAAGDAWVVSVVAVPSSGEIEIGEIDVDENGSLAPQLGVDDVVSALRKTKTVVAMLPTTPPPGGTTSPIAEMSLEELDGFGDLAEDDGTDDPEAVRTRVQALLTNGDEPSLRQARDLMPRLLGDPDRRGITLLRMAAIELRLDEPRLAIGYIEAASREFADRFDMTSLEKAAAMALELLGTEAFMKSQVHQLLEQCRARLRPIDSMFDAPGLTPVREEERGWLEVQAQLRTLSPGDTLVREGEPSRSLFVIKSGLIGVLLEKPTGGTRMVRCCFPGWLLGESSVLVAGDPRCTATLQAQRVSEVWQLDAQNVKEVMRENPKLGERIAETKQIHRIDSFFSMHETMGQLDVQVRDDMIGCIQRIQSFEEDTLILPSGDVPKVACLVARGEITLHQGWELDRAIATITADRFVGVRDALHQIPSDCSALARKGSTIAFFDAERLRAVAASSEQVAAVLERLG